MDWDEVQKKPQKGVTIGETLETLSIGELTSRIEALKAEIVRVEAELTKKRAHDAAASALFKR